MNQVYATIDTIINRPSDIVFDYISNFENNPKWQGGMVEAKFTTNGPLDKGATYDQLAKFMGKDVTTSFLVTEFEPGKKIKIQSVASSFPITVTRMVENMGEQTRVQAVIEGDPAGFYKIAKPMLKWMVQKSVTADYKKLKGLLERGKK
jgi:uncharacterized membrane protein